MFFTSAVRGKKFEFPTGTFNLKEVTVEKILLKESTVQTWQVESFDLEKKLITASCESGHELTFPVATVQQDKVAFVSANVGALLVGDNARLIDVTCSGTRIFYFSGFSEGSKFGRFSLESASLDEKKALLQMSVQIAQHENGIPFFFINNKQYDARNLLLRDGNLGLRATGQFIDIEGIQSIVI